MNKFVQHVPLFVEGCEPKSFTFETQEELVLRLSGLGYGNGEGKWFELSDNRIMEVSDEGYRWWVCGYVKSTTGLTFDKWEAKYKPKLTPDELIAQNENLTSRGITTYNAKDLSISIGGATLTGFACEDIVSVDFNEEL